MKSHVREEQGVKVLDLKGKITIGAGDIQMRETINGLVANGAKSILVNLSAVTTIDSSGVGELVGCHTTVKKNDGSLKLCNLSEKVQDLLTMTQLITVFDVFESESEALASFS